MIRVEVYSDIVCPWCFIGSVRLERVLATWEGKAEVVHRPFLLRPDAPAEGIDIPEMLRKRTGRDPKELFASCEAAARESGLALDLSKQPRLFPTVRAHTLLRHAEAKGTQAALARALFEAHFLQGKNVSDPELLAAVAAPHGFTAEETARLLADARELARTGTEAHAAAAQGIRGVPFFIFDRKLAVSGAQPEAQLREALQRAARA